MKNSSVTNHECFARAFQGHAGEVLTTAQIRDILLKKYPEFSEGAILPNDHGSGNKGACRVCGGKPNRIFIRLERNLYCVRDPAKLYTK